mgnify:CR=1 FL=1
MTRGVAAMASFRQTLSGMLTAVVNAEGPVKAIDVCRSQAPRLAAAASTDGVTVGRATDRARNSAHGLVGWRRDAFAELAAMPPDARANARVVRTLDDGAVAIAQPLLINPPCLICHGTDLSAEVKAALATHYPDDQATGYAVGDLRGIVWAEVR